MVRALRAGRLETSNPEPNTVAENSEQSKEVVDDESSKSQEWVSFKRHFALFRHLTRHGWPTDFMSIASDADGCMESFETFRYFPRSLVLNLAVFENLSRTPIEIVDFVGARHAGRELRAVPTSGGTPLVSATPLDHPRLHLAPGERVAVAMRLTFADGTGQREPRYDFNQKIRNPWGSSKEAARVFQQIKREPPGTIFTSPPDPDPDGEFPTIRKTRESFLAPTLPAYSEYAYGPEYPISGLRTERETIMLEQQESNFLNTTVASSGASCPFLYSWDEEARVWTLHGKVIDAAHERANKMTQVVPVPPGTLRFKLAEEEPEISYIDAVELRLSLADGTEISLRPLHH